MTTTLQDFCIQLPKIELHAHLNGSLSPKTMSELVERKKVDKPELLDFKIPQTLDIDRYVRFFVTHLKSIMNHLCFPAIVSFLFFDLYIN